jgi:hypothetical protein
MGGRALRTFTGPRFTLDRLIHHHDRCRIAVVAVTPLHTHTVRPTTDNPDLPTRPSTQGSSTVTAGLRPATKRDGAYPGLKVRGLRPKISVKALATVADITLLAPKSAPIYTQQIAPTALEADKFYEDQTSAQIARMDANDTLYAFEASRDYNPEPDLEKIAAPMVAVNSADDYINPASLGIIDRDIKRVKNGRFVLLPATDQTRGHYTYILANIWEENLTAVLAESGH